MHTENFSNLLHQCQTAYSGITGAGNPAPPPSGTKHEWRGWSRLSVLTSTPAGSAWAQVCYSGQHNHMKWLTRSHPTVVGTSWWCGCVWFFRMPLRFRFVHWTNCPCVSCFKNFDHLLQQHQTGVARRTRCCAHNCLETFLLVRPTSSTLPIHLPLHFPHKYGTIYGETNKLSKCRTFTVKKCCSNKHQFSYSLCQVSTEMVRLTFLPTSSKL